MIFGYVPIYLSCQINIQFISISIYFHTAYKQVDQKLDANTESQDNVKVIETNVLTISGVNNDVIAGEGYSSMYAHAESTKENGTKTIPIAIPIAIGFLIKNGKSYTCCNYSEWCYGQRETDEVFQKTNFNGFDTGTKIKYLYFENT